MATRRRWELHLTDKAHDELASYESGIVDFADESGDGKRQWVTVEGGAVLVKEADDDGGSELIGAYGPGSWHELRVYDVAVAD